MLLPIPARGAPARGKLQVFARGPVVTKRGTAFKPGQEPEDDDPEDVGTLGLAVGAVGALLNPIVLWSEYTLATTGAGLPPGPGGALGAAEGVGYLVVLGIVAWSLKVKVDTGKGLPAGPSGLLGAAEGLSYLSLLGGAHGTYEWGHLLS